MNALQSRAGCLEPLLGDEDAETEDEPLADDSHKDCSIADADADADPPPILLVVPIVSTAPRLAPLDDSTLAACIVRIAQARDERALSTLYDATIARVYSLVLRVLRRPSWAEEVVEDTYFQVWRQAVRFDADRGRAMTWLLAMARSRAIDAWRRETRFDHVSLDDDEGTESCDLAAAACDDLLEFSRNHALLQLAIARLPAQARQLISLAFLRGCSHEEIAADMALPLGTVKSQIRRALVAMRATMSASVALAGSGAPTCLAR